MCYPPSDGADNTSRRKRGRPLTGGACFRLMGGCRRGPCQGCVGWHVVVPHSHASSPSSSAAVALQPGEVGAQEVEHRGLVGGGEPRQFAVAAGVELNDAEGAEVNLTRIDGYGHRWGRRGGGGRRAAGEVAARGAEQVADVAAGRDAPSGRLGAQAACQAQREADVDAAHGVLGLPPAPRGPLCVVVGTRRGVDHRACPPLPCPSRRLSPVSRTVPVTAACAPVRRAPRAR